MRESGIAALEWVNYTSGASEWQKAMLSERLFIIKSIVDEAALMEAKHNRK